MDNGIVKTILTIELSNAEFDKKIEEFMKLLRKTEDDMEEELLDEDYLLTEDIFNEDGEENDDMDEQFLTMECFDEEENIKDIL